MSSAQPAPRPWTYADLVALPDDQLRHGLTDVTTLTVEAAGILESPLFPGLRIPLRDVFRGR